MAPHDQHSGGATHAGGDSVQERGRRAPSAVVVFEPNFSGHRMDYVREVYELARARGQRVYLASSSDAFRSEEFAMRFGALQDSQLGRLDLGALRDISRSEYWTWLRRGLRGVTESVRPDRLVVLEGDKLLRRLWMWRIGGRVTVLVMRYGLRDLESWTDRAKALGKILLGGLCRARGHRVVALTPGESASSTAGWRFGVRRVPDPVRLRASPTQISLYKEAMQMESGRHWFGVFGHIVRRKHTDMVARAVLSAGFPERCGLLIAGRFADGELARCSEDLSALSRSGAKVVVDDRLLPDAILDAAIQSVGTVIVAYDTPGPSGILSKALAAGQAVLLAGDGIGDATAQRASGLVQRAELSVAGLASGVVTSLDRGTVPGAGVRLTQDAPDPGQFAAGLL